MTARANRATLEALLQARRLAGTLVPTWQPASPEGVAPTGVPAIDRWLGGGFPRGQLSEIVGPPSSGRTGLLCALLAAATARGELVALVDTLDTFDPESGAAAGIELSRLLWIRGASELTPGTSRRGAIVGEEYRARVLGRAIKALGLVLQAGGFGVVGLDLAGVPARAIRGLPFTTWLRVARALEGRDTACVLLAPEPIARSAAGQTVALRAIGPAGRWSGESDRARLFRGFDVRARLASARLRDAGEIELVMEREQEKGLRTEERLRTLPARQP